MVSLECSQRAQNVANKIEKNAPIRQKYFQYDCEIKMWLIIIGTKIELSTLCATCAANLPCG